VTGTPEWQMDVSIPHPARIYDYWLGGKDNFEADRGASVFALNILPELADYARANRGFLVRGAVPQSGRHNAVPRYR
jgi:S-adenosyl methyltransferase